MGNLNIKLSQAKPISQYNEILKNTEDTRSETEIDITDRLTYLLSDLNVSRVTRRGHVSAGELDWSHYVFVCFQGFPAPSNQFDVLELPGKCVYFASANFREEAQSWDHETRMKCIRESTFQKQAHKINALFYDIDKSKKLVLVYHSAGNFLMSMYFKYYGDAIWPRIKGMIDISGGPLRFYLAAQLFTPLILQTDFEQIEANADKVHKMLIKTISQTGFDLGFKSKYQTLSFLNYIKGEGYGQIFQATKMHPRILKFIVHGRNDTLFESKLLNQKAIYFIYRSEPQISSLQLQHYNTIYKTPITASKIQQRFVLALQRGQHSVHRQPRNTELIRNGVHQYLTVIHE